MFNFNFFFFGNFPSAGGLFSESTSGTDCGVDIHGVEYCFCPQHNPKPGPSSRRILPDGHFKKPDTHKNPSPSLVADIRER